MTRTDFLKGGFGCAAVSLFGGCRSHRASVGETYPGWEPGELDIHLIHTGCGEQTFFCFPDGTTMLLDCGDANRRPDYVAAIPKVPLGGRSAGESVAAYISRLVVKRQIDYLMVSHWHSDHVCGIPAVASEFGFGYFLCHQPKEIRSRRRDIEKESVPFVADWLPSALGKGLVELPFTVGALDQIALLHDGAGTYAKDFEVRNIAANGVVWNSTDGVRDCAGEHVRRTGRPIIPENMLSAAIRIRYGKFRYFSGGDIEREFVAADGSEYSYEGLVGSSVGPVEVCKTNHHAYRDAMSAPFVREVRSRFFISSTWSPNQINDRNLPIMTSRELYPGDRTICFGCIPEAKKREYASRSFMRDVSPEAGHIAVKVAPGGNSYTVFVLDASDELMRITRTDTVRIC